ncbi:MAG: PEP/pyruvate-binding domain-containing protein [Myxococcota bacterium]
MLLARFDRPLLELAPEERVRLLGGKGDGLMRMAGELALPVPPGFILTTRACALHLEHGWTDELEAALREGLAWLEQRTGRHFGAGAGAPLLVSVRSGAPVSMPGMLDTLLNVGLDDATTAALARENPSLAAACRARLEASFHDLVGTPPPTDVFAQLRSAVEAVFRSARSPRALAYRRHEGLEGDALTAVNVQTMVFGHRDARSATGVFFTRDPSTGEARPFGDVLFEAQGEDVVSGRHATLPYAALASRLPEVAHELDAIGRRLEQAYRDLCEIEFTIESGRLWLLQVRVGKRSPRAALRIARELALDPAFPLERHEAVLRVAKLLTPPPTETRLATTTGSSTGPASAASPASLAPSAPLARGLGASPGFATGELATTVAGAVARAGAGHAVVLARPETSPEDVEGMGVAAGLLTARGGLASHAAVVARGWGIPAVVGVDELAIDEAGITLAGARIAVGQPITIDGTSGAVYAGALEIERRIVPEAALLLEWARELGIALGDGAGSGVGAGDGSASVGATAAVGAGAAPTSDANAAEDLDEAILRVLAIKGSATREALVSAIAVGVDPEPLAARIEARITAGDLVPAKPIGLRLGEAARERAQALLADDRARLGVALAEAVIVAFQPLDVRMKEAVTDWQLRLENGERVPNDHGDARWDTAVLERLGALVSDATRWLAEPAARLPRLNRYAGRLERARTAALAGDARFVASPRVDSLHGVWFELHEELIRLAGSDRAKELAAGRAG